MTDLPRKFHIPSSELVPCEIGVNGLATCRTHEVDVRWIHSPDPADEERFINLTGTYLVVGGNDHIVKVELLFTCTHELKQDFGLCN